MYQSKYEGKQIDEAVSQAIDKLPVRMKEAEKGIADLTKNKADAESIPKKISQLEDDVGLNTTKQTAQDNKTEVSLLKEEVKKINETIEDLPAGEGGNGVPMISVHDEAYSTIIPEDGQVYVVKYEELEEDSSIYFKMAVGDGSTLLSNLPQMRIEDVREYVNKEIGVINAQVGDIETALDDIATLMDAYINPESTND